MTRRIGSTCAALRPNFGAFIDGELRGIERLPLSIHLESCPECAGEVQELRRAGDLLRTAASGQTIPAQLESLASRVISQRRAEVSQSWRNRSLRIFDGWRWMIVGGGSVAATFASTMLLVAMLAFGQQSREDSLSALMGDLSAMPLVQSNLVSADGVLFVYATPIQGPSGTISYSIKDQTLEGAHASAAYQATLVTALADALMSHGRILSLNEMRPERRRYTELLFDRLSDMRSGNYSAVVSNEPEIRFVPSTDAPGLPPIHVVASTEVNGL